MLADGTLLARSVEIEKLDRDRKSNAISTSHSRNRESIPSKSSFPRTRSRSDNHRFAAVDINIANPVLIIDGNPDNDDGSYVSTALAADPAITGYSPRIESPDFLRHGSLDPFRCIYLLNVPQLPADAIESWRTMSAAAGARLVFGGCRETVVL